MFFVALVGFSVCYQHCSKRYERIAIKFYGGVMGGKEQVIRFGSDLDHHPALAEVCTLRPV